VFFSFLLWKINLVNENKVVITNIVYFRKKMFGDVFITVFLTTICLVNLSSSGVVATPGTTTTLRSILSQGQRQQQVPTNPQRLMALRNAEPEKHHSTTPSPISHKRSARCLINELAHFNGIEAKYHFVGETGLPHNKTFTYQLLLGKERYSANGLSKKKAKEKVAREAYSLTKYKKPPVKPKTCTTDKSTVNMVQEWAQRNGKRVSYYVKRQNLGPPKTYVMECWVDGNLTTEAENTLKKAAKQEAAEKMLEKVKWLRFSVDNGKKYNKTEFLTMNAISRLNEIQLARHEMEPRYQLLEEIKKVDEKGKDVTVFVMQVTAGKEAAIGFGETMKKAKLDASERVLAMKDFVIKLNT